MLSKKIVKIVSAHRLARVGVYVAAATLSLSFLIVAASRHAHAPSADCEYTYRIDLANVRLIPDSDEIFNIERAATESARTLGLSGRDCIAPNAAMLFEFADSAQHGIWMKDMTFSIDIVWLDDTKTITHVEKYVSPATYPEVFVPGSDSRYVIEFHEGVAARNNIAPGQRLNW
jgi:uncharacterized membrane protein (UPF0127 family)